MAVAVALRSAVGVGEAGTNGVLVGDGLGARAVMVAARAACTVLVTLTVAPDVGVKVGKAVTVGGKAVSVPPTAVCTAIWNAMVVAPKSGVKVGGGSVTVETGVQVGVAKGVSVAGPPGVPVAMTGVGVGTAVKVATTTCCTATAIAWVVAAASGVGCRVMGTGVGGTTVGTGGCAVKVALTPALTTVCKALAVAVASTVVAAGKGVAVKVGSAGLSLPPVLTVTVAIGAGSAGPANRSPKK